METERIAKWLFQWGILMNGVQSTGVTAFSSFEDADDTRKTYVDSVKKLGGKAEVEITGPIYVLAPKKG